MTTFLKKWIRPRDWWNLVWENPVILKEMRSRMRGWRAILGLTGFLLLIGGTVGLIYIAFFQSGAAVSGVTARKNIGQTIFYTIYCMQLFIVALAAPGMTAGAIASEREQQTYDLLRTTLLTARALVLGKLIAAISFALLLLIASLPLQSIGFLFGGISLGEVVIGILIIVLTAFNFGAIGLFFSAIVHRSRIATVISQAVTMTLTIVLPILAIVGLAVVASFYAARTSSPPELLLVVIGWLVATASPIATAVVTELMLVEQQSLFIFQVPISGTQVWLPQPWIGFAVLYVLSTLLFIFLTVRIVRRPERQ